MSGIPLDADELRWRDLRMGKLCSLCEQPMSEPPRGRFVYCSTCASTPALAPRRIQVHVDHGAAWIVVMLHLRRKLTYGLPTLTYRQLQRLVQRLRVGMDQRARFWRGMKSWHRGSSYAHLTPREARIFLWACRRQLCKPRPHTRRYV